MGWTKLVWIRALQEGNDGKKNESVIIGSPTIVLIIDTNHKNTHLPIHIKYNTQAQDCVFIIIFFTSYLKHSNVKMLFSNIKGYIRLSTHAQ